MIRKITKEDREKFIRMSKEFYSTPAVSHSIPASYHEKAFDEMIERGIYVEGYIFEVDNKEAGYAMIAKTYSQEAGGLVLWVEEIYILEQYRGSGLGREFFDYLESNLKSSVKRIRLEVSNSNERAMKLYESLGFSILDYKQMYKEYK